MAHIIQFQKAMDKRNNKIAAAKTLSGKKVRLIDYFREEFIEKINLLPVDESCLYEKILVELCDVLMNAAPEEKAQRLAEAMMSMEDANLAFDVFVEKIAADDLIFGCIVSEFSRLSRLDKLFLLNVLADQFPAAKGAINTLKLVVFADNEMLEEALVPQNG